MKSTKKRKRRVEFNIRMDEGIVAAALEEFAKVFPMENSGPCAGRIAERLVVFALSQVDVIGPRLSAMVRYCQAEDLNQHAYLESLIKTKFAKKLHLKPARRKI